MIKAKPPFDGDRIIIAERKHWTTYLLGKFDELIGELVGTSQDLTCMVCSFSLNYTSKGSLLNHLRLGHSHGDVVNYYLNNRLEKLCYNRVT